jgi:hypothetical protein
VTDDLTVEFEEFGPDQRAVDEAVRAVTEQASLPRDAETRLLALDLLDPPRKVARPRPPSRIRATLRLREQPHSRGRSCAR